MNDKIIPLEINVEERLVSGVEHRGGWTIKLYTGWVAGLPDRLVLHSGRAWLVECKKRDGRAGKSQRIVHRKLASVGFPVQMLYTNVQVDNWLNEQLGLV